MCFLVVKNQDLTLDFELSFLSLITTNLLRLKAHTPLCQHTMPNNNDDIRWIQRFDNYQRALDALQEAVELSQQRALSKLEQQGLIQGFEFTHELAWKTLKDFLD